MDEIPIEVAAVFITNSHVDSLWELIEGGVYFSNCMLFFGTGFMCKLRRVLDNEIVINELCDRYHLSRTSSFVLFSDSYDRKYHMTDSSLNAVMKRYKRTHTVLELITYYIPSISDLNTRSNVIESLLDTEMLQDSDPHRQAACLALCDDPELVLKYDSWDGFINRDVKWEHCIADTISNRILSKGLLDKYKSHPELISRPTVLQSVVYGLPYQPLRLAYSYSSFEFTVRGRWNEECSEELKSVFNDGPLSVRQCISIGIQLDMNDVLFRLSPELVRGYFSTNDHGMYNEMKYLDHVRYLFKVGVELDKEHHSYYTDLIVLLENDIEPRHQLVEYTTDCGEVDLLFTHLHRHNLYDKEIIEAVFEVPLGDAIMNAGDHEVIKYWFTVYPILIPGWKDEVLVGLDSDTPFWKWVSSL